MIMKKILICVVFFSFMLSHPAMSGEEGVPPEMLDQIEKRTLQPFFNALKSGDVGALKSIMGGAMYEESRWSLEENVEYPGFLRRHYKDAIFTVEGGIIIDDQVIIDVGIAFPVIGKQVSQFYLQRPDSGLGKGNSEQAVGERHWRISEQRHNQLR